MNFQVPQFIEQQPKIVGFLTLPQFLYIAAGGGVVFLLFYLLNFFLWFMLSALVAGFTITLAFVKIDGQDLPKILKAALNYLWQPRTYTWQRPLLETSIDTSDLEKLEELRKKMGIQEKLKAVALSVTTGKFFSDLKSAVDQKNRYQVVTYVTGEKRMAKRVDY